jgi:hypothetical protein
MNYNDQAKIYINTKLLMYKCISLRKIMMYSQYGNFCAIFGKSIQLIDISKNSDFELANC